jgi:hypothetical protein
MTEDWRYSEDRMKVRESVLKLLLSRYGGAINPDGTPLVDPEKIYACAHDWVSQGNARTDGIMAYFKAYYL